MAKYTLKPCPFCGSEARLVLKSGNRGMTHINATYYVRCTNKDCAVETPFFDSSAGFMDDGTFQMFSDGAYDAVSLWNRRTDGTTEKTEKTV